MNNCPLCNVPLISLKEWNFYKCIDCNVMTSGYSIDTGECTTYVKQLTANVVLMCIPALEQAIYMQYDTDCDVFAFDNQQHKVKKRIVLKHIDIKSSLSARWWERMIAMKAFW